MKTPHVQFAGNPYTVEQFRYPGGQLGLMLVPAPKDGKYRDEDYVVATKNMRPYGAVVPDDIALVKDYSEGEGTLAALVDAGIVEPVPEQDVPSGYVVLKAVRLLVPVPELER